MREFSWSIFMATGSIESYLLFKEHEKIVTPPTEEQEEWEESSDL